MEAAIRNSHNFHSTAIEKLQDELTRTRKRPIQYHWYYAQLLLSQTNNTKV
jgi:hypothetical protein